MKVETWLFGAGAFFFLPLALVYGLATRWKEPLGVTGLLLSSGLALMIALYLFITSRRISPRPEDDPLAEIAEGAGELGTFAPYSWAPLWLGLSSALIFAGLAVGVWLALIGLGLGSIALILWVFEYYRGEHAH
jgi:hypothetical protein